MRGRLERFHGSLTVAGCAIVDSLTAPKHIEVR
jgi:hypothetical protein